MKIKPTTFIFRQHCQTNSKILHFRSSLCLETAYIQEGSMNNYLLEGKIPIIWALNYYFICIYVDKNHPI